MFDRDSFEEKKTKNAALLGSNEGIHRKALDLIVEAEKYDYAYQWTWLGMPIIQLPQDVFASQEIYWKTKPTVIIETGIAWGGSVVFHAAMLSLMGGHRKVIAIDRVIMPHIREEIMKYPFSACITLIESESTDEAIAEAIKGHIAEGDSVSVFLDSSHDHDHVLRELNLYAQFVTVGQYMNVYATAIEKMPVLEHRKRSWGTGNSPATAIESFLAANKRFVIDSNLDKKVLGSFITGGRLICIC